MAKRPTEIDLRTPEGKAELKRLTAKRKSKYGARNIERSGFRFGSSKD